MLTLFSTLAVFAVGCQVEGGVEALAPDATSDTQVAGDTSTTDTSTTPDTTGGGDTNTTMPGDTSVPPDTTVTPVPVGIACSDKAECGDDGLCGMLLPGGYCTASCETTACPEGSACAEINDFPFCLQSCQSDSDCRQAEGYACLDGVCNIECTDDVDCGPNQVCNANVCEMSPATQALGEACTASEQCLTNYCLSPDNGGVCSEPCSTTQPCTDPSWECMELTPVGGNADLRLCGPVPEISIEVIDIDPNDWPYSFNVPDDTVSFMIVAEAPSLDDQVGIYNISRPDGVRVAGFPDNFGFTNPYRTNPGDGTTATILPNNADPDLQIVPGTWEFAASIFGSQSPLARVRVFLKRTDDGNDPASGRMDLNIFIAAGAKPGLTAANAANDPEISGSVTRMAEYWEPNGLEIGEVRYYDIGSEYAAVGSRNELDTMFASQTGAGAENALNVFIVDYLLDQYTAGIAGGIPGPHPVAGTGASGVAVELQGGGAASGDDMTHELGHYLGFYHVSEQPQPISGDACTSSSQCPNNTECMYFGQEWGNLCALRINDIIGDTTECNWDSWNEPCMDNIMYPSLLTGHRTQSISNEQGRIGRLSPIAY